MPNFVAHGRLSLRQLLATAVVGLACAHVLVIACTTASLLSSNAIQTVVSCFTVFLCIREAHQASTWNFRRLWTQLAVGFGLWTLAQFCFFGSVLLTGHPPVFPSWDDALWLTFAFPILLATSDESPEIRAERISFIDQAQAFLFFALLYAIAFSSPPMLSMYTVYLVQGIALVFVCALRYSSTSHPGEERCFYRNLGMYLLLYTACSVIGVILPTMHCDPGRWVDLCWSLPLLCFCMLILVARAPAQELKTDPSWRTALATHVKALSAFGVAVLSFSAACEYALHRPRMGIVAASASFLLFAVRTSVRETQLSRAHATVRNALLRDSLTGLGNRALLGHELAACLAAAPESTGLLFLDVDRFKTVNDALGHTVGDLLLKEISARLCEMVRPTDIVCRLGGDEFIVLLRNAELYPTRQFTGRLMERLCDPMNIHGRTLRITMSAGVAFGAPDCTAEDLLRNADCALQRAKKLGRDRVQVFESAMACEVGLELALEQELRECLQRKGLSVFFQPIYCLSEERIAGFEALVRWQHPVSGMISPAAFIPLAEERGLIVEIGRQVLQQACRQVGEWNRVLGTHFTLAVNVSPHQLVGDDLLREVRQTLLETQLEARLLHLELTESALMSGMEDAESLLNNARALGVAISLDDFGTGHSSLSYLLRLPFDTVKIDRSFVKDIDRDAKRAELVRTIVQLGRNLGKRVVVEGVETEAELACLRQLGCDFVQGYRISRPLPVEGIEALFRANGLPAVSKQGSSLGLYPEHGKPVASAISRIELSGAAGPMLPQAG